MDVLALGPSPVRTWRRERWSCVWTRRSQHRGRRRVLDQWSLIGVQQRGGECSSAATRAHCSVSACARCLAAGCPSCARRASSCSLRSALPSRVRFATMIEAEYARINYVESTTIYFRIFLIQIWDGAVLSARLCSGEELKRIHLNLEMDTQFNQ